MSAPTQLSTAQQLGVRLQELSDVIEELRVAELDAISARHEANVSEYKAFLAATGSVDLRKITARLEVEELTFLAEVAEAKVRHLVRVVREKDKRVDVGRTYSADLRAEAKVVGLTPGTMT